MAVAVAVVRGCGGANSIKEAAAPNGGHVKSHGLQVDEPLAPWPDKTGQDKTRHPFNQL